MSSNNKPKLNQPEYYLAEIEKSNNEAVKIFSELKQMLNQNKNDMKFFEGLMNISPNVDITLRVFAKNDKLTVSITPSIKEVKIPAIIVTGTPQQLDDDLLDKIAEPIKEAVLTIQNIKEQQEALKLAEEESKKKNISKPPAPKTDKKAKLKEEKKVAEPPEAKEEKTPAPPAPPQPAVGDMFA